VWKANPTDKTVSLPFLFRLAAGGLGGPQKNERKRFWSGGRRSDSGAAHAVDVCLFALPRASRVRYGFKPPRARRVNNQSLRDCFSKKVRAKVSISAHKKTKLLI